MHKRLKDLRAHMQGYALDYYLIPSSDPHHNEHVPDDWQRRRWISGFTGSAGTVLVHRKKCTPYALLWTDSRYILQAEQELEPVFFQLMRPDAGDLSLEAYLSSIPSGSRLGVDPQVISLFQARSLRRAVESADSTLIAVEKNLVDAIWLDRPEAQYRTITIHPIEYAGLSVQEKLKQLRTALRDQKADACIINTLDAIAWLFNLRGQDIAHYPVFRSYAIITCHQATLFVHPESCSPMVLNYCRSEHIILNTHAQFLSAIHALRGCVVLDPRSCTLWIHDQCAHTTICETPSPIDSLKAIKNPVEHNGMRTAHIIDAVSVLRFWMWLEMNWKTGITEGLAADMLDKMRLEGESCVGLSFKTISAFGHHGAVVHYAVSNSSDCLIDGHSFYLVDSGGQYPMGTTDITRTFHLGEPTALQKKHYTLVLQAHLNVRHAVFPAGTTGDILDAWARMPLWKEGLDYGHGTGHGVGCFLNVHEAPPSLSSRRDHMALEPGMMVSNEPGFYWPGHYGIRIENVCCVTQKYAASECLLGHGPFYGLEDLTLVPYANHLIDARILSHTEQKAINRYHEKIRSVLMPLIQDPDLRVFLEQKTAQIEI